MDSCKKIRDIQVIATPTAIETITKIAKKNVIFKDIFVDPKQANRFVIYPLIKEHVIMCVMNVQAGQTIRKVNKDALPVSPIKRPFPINPKSL